MAQEFYQIFLFQDPQKNVLQSTLAVYKQERKLTFFLGICLWKLKFFSKLVYDTLIPNKSSIRTYAKNIFYLWENIKKFF